MDSIDDLIQRFLAAEMKARPAKRFGDAPSEEDYCAFLAGKLEGKRLEGFLEHLARDPWSRELVARAREIGVGRGGPDPGGPSAETLRKAKEAFGEARTRSALNCPHCGKRISAFPKDPRRSRWEGYAWLALAAAAFAISFFVPRYFIQCLLVAFLAALKWIWDGRLMRTQILVYKALKESAETDDLQKYRSHL